MQTTPESDPLELCTSVAELVYVGDALCGREVVKYMLENIEPEREHLLKLARELKGRADPSLVEMVREVAKTAPKSKRLTFKQRWRRHLKRQKCA
jgi:hypothetical protein